MASTDPDQTTPFYRASWLPVLPAALTVAGIILFGVLNLGYSLFYERLGVSPDAVGLNYANVLARSTILVALVALAVVVSAGATSSFPATSRSSGTLRISTRTSSALSAQQTRR